MPQVIRMVRSGLLCSKLHCRWESSNALTTSSPTNTRKLLPQNMFDSYTLQSHFSNIDASCPWSPGGCGQKSFKLVWWCHWLLSGFLAKGLTPSVTSLTSVANDKSDNEMIPGAVHRSPGICLQAEENLGKPQLGDRGCSTSHLLKWGPFSPNEVGRIAQHVKKG